MRQEHRAAQSLETPCNICGAADYDVVGTRDRQGRPLRTVICRACGLVWTNPRPTAADMDEYYRWTYRADYSGSRIPTERKLLRGLTGALERRRWLAGQLRPGAVVLDVGCGAGELVYLLQSSGIDATGLEPDEAYADFARQTLKIQIERGTVAAWQCPEARFDLVMMFHSLEHLSDPAATLSRIHSWLKPFGLLAIEVPNVESRCQAPRHRYHYAHLYSFSPGTLEALARKAGFALVGHELSADDGNIRALFRRLPHDRLPTRPAEAASTQYVRTMRILRRHTSVRHYLSRHPYLRPLDRLRQRRTENRLLSALPTHRDILEWAAAGGMTSRLLR